jgi:hypothetical protein
MDEITIDWNALAHAAYETYGEVLNHRSQQPLPMPEWDELPPRLQEAWREVAKEVCRLYEAAE